MFRKQPDNPDVPDQRCDLFFHEYTHHLMTRTSRSAYPEWYSEGFAEFFSTPKFDRDGSVWLVGPLRVAPTHSSTARRLPFDRSFPV